MQTAESGTGKCAALAAAFALGVAAIGFSSGAAAQAIGAGDTLKLEWGFGASNANGGGAFKATVLSGPALNETFLTFCVERNEYFSIGQTLSVQQVNTAAVNGGLGGGNPDPLDARTAYLYTRFSNNALFDVNDASTRKANGEALQLAVWAIEDEWNPLSLSGQAKTWYDDANTAVAAGGDWYGMGIGQVRILNLITTDATGKITYKQDQLYITPVPEPETYVLLLAGLGLMGFAVRRRAKKQPA